MDSTLLITVLSIIFGSSVVTTILNRIFTKRDRKNEEKSGIKEALRLLMKTRVRDLCLKYIDQGWIYADEYDDLQKMWHCYHDHDKLDGNGFLNHLMEEVDKLDIRGIRKETNKK